MMQSQIHFVILITREVSFGFCAIAHFNFYNIIRFNYLVAQGIYTNKVPNFRELCYMP